MTDYLISYTVKNTRDTLNLFIFKNVLLIYRKTDCNRTDAIQECQEKKRVATPFGKEMVYLRGRWIVQ